jgi:predicted acyltransferase
MIQAAKLQSSKPRLHSLDVFRGLTVMVMTLVNNPGDWGHIYPPLEHATWNGCTVADLVFPFFLFIVGVSIVYALDTKKQDVTQHGALMLKIVKRAAIIFGLGVFMSLYWYWDFSTVRIPGVLQRIALAYLISAFIFIKTDYKAQIGLLIFFLIAYYLLLTQIQVPGYGPANLQPETNLGAWIDRTLLGTNHLWKQSRTWDPEGLLGTLPAVGTALLGILTGTWLRQKSKTEMVKVYGMLGAGLVLVVTGWLLNPVFPINKSLWTSTFVLFTGGLAMLLLGLCYWLIDVKGYRKLTKPFVVYGVNAITVFVASGLLARTMNKVQIDYQGDSVSISSAMYDAFFDNYLSPINASLAWAISYVLVWLVILWIMYNRGILVKI